jgi:hypothetical protein
MQVSKVATEGPTANLSVINHKARTSKTVGIGDEAAPRIFGALRAPPQAPPSLACFVQRAMASLEVGEAINDDEEQHLLTAYGGVVIVVDCQGPTLAGPILEQAIPRLTAGRRDI